MVTKTLETFVNFTGGSAEHRAISLMANIPGYTQGTYSSMCSAGHIFLTDKILFLEKSDLLKCEKSK